MNSLWPATSWVSRRQTFFASSFSHAEKTTAKSADGLVAPAIGLLWLLITLLTLLRKLHSKHRQTPGQMFSEHPWYVAVYTNVSSKWQVVVAMGFAFFCQFADGGADVLIIFTMFAAFPGHGLNIFWSIC